MSGQLKRIGLYTLILFITLLAWSIGLTNTQRIQAFNRSVELRYTEGQLTLEKVRNIFKQEEENIKRNIESIVAWNQGKTENLQNQSLKRSAKANVLTIYGDLNALIPFEKLIGKSIFQGDTEGVLITKKLADELWGNRDVLGKPLFYEGKEYCIRGIIDHEEESLLVVPASSEDDDVTYSGLRIRFSESKNIKQQVQNFKSKYGLPEGDLIDLAVMSTIVGQLMFLPVWFMGFLILAKLCKLIYTTYRYWVGCIILCCMTVGVTVIVLSIMQFPLEIPSDWIPNKWSDFEFWTRLGKELKASNQVRQSLPSLVPDLWINEIVRSILVGLGIIAIGFTTLIKKVEVIDLNSVFLNSLIAIIISFLALITNYLLGNDVVSIRGLWLIWPVYMSIKYFTIKWKSYLGEEE